MTMPPHSSSAVPPGKPLPWLLRVGRNLLTVPTCPCCGAEAADRDRPCPACVERWAWPARLLHDSRPLRFWAVGIYGDHWRSQLLTVRKKPSAAVLDSAAERLVEGLGWQGDVPLLQPVPGWKRKGNPLPELLAHSLSAHAGWPVVQWLKKRPRPGQHHLGAGDRQQNLRDAFRLTSQARKGCGQLVFLVDDILTTGSTALAAAEPFEAAGIPVAGLLCLARTPAAGSRRKRS